MRKYSRGDSFHSPGLGSRNVVARGRMSASGMEDRASDSRVHSVRLDHLMDEDAPRSSNSGSGSGIRAPISVITDVFKRRHDANMMEGRVSEGGHSSQPGSPALAARQPYYRLDGGLSSSPGFARFSGGQPGSPLKLCYVPHPAQHAPQFQKTSSLKYQREASEPGFSLLAGGGGEVQGASPNAAVGTNSPASLSRLHGHGSHSNQARGPLGAEAVTEQQQATLFNPHSPVGPRGSPRATGSPLQNRRRTAPSITADAAKMQITLGELIPPGYPAADEGHVALGSSAVAADPVPPPDSPSREGPVDLELTLSLGLGGGTFSPAAAGSATQLLRHRTSNALRDSPMAYPFARTSDSRDAGSRILPPVSPPMRRVTFNGTVAALDPPPDPVPKSISSVVRRTLTRMQLTTPPQL